MSEPEGHALRGLVISDFNAETFTRSLNHDSEAPAVHVLTAPFGQVVPSLTGEGLDGMDFAVVWTRPEGVIGAFRDLLDYRPVEPARLAEEVDRFAELLIAAGRRVRFLFVPTWVLPGSLRGFGPLELRSKTGLARSILAMNLRLVDRLSASPTVFPLNSSPWVEGAGEGAFSDKLWYLAKSPFGNTVFTGAARDLKAALRGLTGLRRKLVLLDLDDTLWGGSVGEVGREGVRLGGHDPVGEAYADFQRGLKALTRRGVLLGIVSKNEERVAVEALADHPEMVLRPEDFSGWRINWQDKAANVAELLEELNLGPESAVFIDNDPVQRGRVSQAIPQVLTPDWPSDPMHYLQALRSLRCFDTDSLSREDAQRTGMYAAERKRRNLRESIPSLETWLEDLSTVVRLRELADENVERAVQLLNRTNQMNLTTRRMNGQELRAWRDSEGHHLWTFRVSDRFGDSGLVGLLGLEVGPQVGRVTDFVLSCRVMGRRVEETMLHTAVSKARELGLGRLEATWVATEKNDPCLKFFEGSGLERCGDAFVWRMDREYPAPLSIQAEREAGR